MKFSTDEIDLAQLFKAYGLEWTPSVGHFVYDQSQLIEVESPFQKNVYFILDLKHFLRRSESLVGLKERVCWLPTWEQARELLKSLGVDDKTIADRLIETRAIETGSERLELYRMIEEVMTGALA